MTDSLKSPRCEPVSFCPAIDISEAVDLTFWFPGSSVSVCIDSHPLFFPDLFELMEHVSLTSLGLWKNSLLYTVSAIPDTI